MELTFSVVSVKAFVAQLPLQRIFGRGGAVVIPPAFSTPQAGTSAARETIKEKTVRLEKAGRLCGLYTQLITSRFECKVFGHVAFFV